MATPETRQQLLAAVAACEDKKGEDTRILELDPADSGLADFFLITSASNDRQVVAIADEIEFRLKKDFGLYATSVEGRRQAEWILLDYIDIVVHVFLAEKRAFYDIERLRKSARNLSAPELESEVESELKAALAKKTRAVRNSAPAAKSPAAKAVTPKKSSKGESTVTAKPAKKAVKKAAVKAAPKPAKAAKAKPAAEVKTAAKPAKKAAKKAAKKTTDGKVLGVVAPVTDSRVSSGGFGAKAPTFGAKPPVLQTEAPDAPISLAAEAAPRPAKKAKK